VVGWRWWLCHRVDTLVEAELGAARVLTVGVCPGTATVWEKSLLTWVCFPVTGAKTGVETEG